MCLWCCARKGELTALAAAMGAFSNIKGLSYYGDAKDDPYVTLDAVRLLPLGSPEVPAYFASYAAARGRGARAGGARDHADGQPPRRGEDGG